MTGLLDCWIPTLQQSNNQLIPIIKMPKIQLDMPALDFLLHDFLDHPVRLSDFSGKTNVVLVFNRGFF